MLNRLQKLRAQQSEKGFTIIEVMIVLAIAGLIIVIVLLAVPALQRNGRNTAIRSDANQTLGYISTFNTDNQGANPTVAGSSITAGNVTVAGAAGTNSSTGHIQAGTTGTFVQAAVPTAAAVTPAAGSVTVVLGARCPNTYSGTAITPTNSIRSVAVIYAIETTSGLAAQCIGS